MTPILALRQVALAAGNLSDTLHWWERTLALTVHARFDPPGIAFIMLGETRLFFATSNAPATIYLAVEDVQKLHERMSKAGIGFLVDPTRVHIDREGFFGPKDEVETMAFIRDPAENSIGLISRNLP